MRILPKTILGLVLFILAITAANAEPVRYLLDTDKSSVGFTYSFEGNLIKGTMPVANADITIDFDSLSASKVRINLNARNARAGFIFATEAIRGKSVLDAAKHPLIRFASTGISQTAQGAVINGKITIRGITRPITLAAGFYRQKGGTPTDLSRLTILLTGSVSRAAFGATGYPKLVGDNIDLRIIASIRRIE